MEFKLDDVAETRTATLWPSVNGPDRVTKDVRRGFIGPGGSQPFHRAADRKDPRSMCARPVEGSGPCSPGLLQAVHRDHSSCDAVNDARCRPFTTLPAHLVPS